MFSISEQQAFELTKRCEAIKEVSDPTVFEKIETLVKQVTATQRLTDDEVNQLYKLLNCAVVFDYSEPIEDETQNIWDEEKPPTKDENAEAQGIEARERDMRNHLLLCNRANLRTIEAMRHCIKLIAIPENSVSLSQRHTRI